jgi:ABC-type Fe3+ transport system substrate-binding protein
MKREKRNLLRGFALGMGMFSVFVFTGGGGLHSAVAAEAGNGSGGAKFNALVEAARKEAKENPTVMIRYPGMRDQALRSTQEALKKEFGIDVSLVNDNKGFSESVITFIEEYNAGRPAPVLMYGSLSAINPASEKGVLRDDIDWGGVFGEKWPIVKQLSDRQAWPRVRGGCLNFIDVVYVIVYNKRLREADVPSSWDDLLKPHFQRNIGLSPTAIIPSFNRVIWGEEKTLDYTRKLKSQNVVWNEGGSAALAAMVASGEVLAAVINVNYAEARKKKGDPVDWNFAEDGLYYHSSPLCVPKNASHPNLAALLIAYWAAEGVGGPIGSVMGWSRITPDQQGALGEKAKARGLDVRKFVDRSSEEEQAAERKFRKQVGEVLGTLK